MAVENLNAIVEAALLAAERPLTVDRLLALFDDGDRPTKQEIKQALSALDEACAERGVELVEVSSGYRYQVRQSYGEWINRMFEERAPRYSRAVLETLALICYKQPVTRAEVEDVRGVAVSSNIIRTLLDRDWIKVVGHRDVPGKPALYGTTAKLLDDLGLKRLDQLPPLAEIKALDQIPFEMDLFAEQMGLSPLQEGDTAAETAEDGATVITVAQDSGDDALDESGADEAIREPAAVADDLADSANDNGAGQASAEQAGENRPDEQVDVTEDVSAVELAGS